MNIVTILNRIIRRPVFLNKLKKSYFEGKTPCNFESVKFQVFRSKKNMSVFMEPLKPTWEEMRDFPKYMEKLYKKGMWENGITLVSFLVGLLWVNEKHDMTNELKFRWLSCFFCQLNRFAHPENFEISCLFHWRMIFY